MIPTTWYMAEVVNNDDSQLEDQAKLGRVQVRILPELVGVDDTNKAMLPWARPFVMPATVHFNPPAIGKKIYVLAFDQYFKVLFYMDEIFQDHLQKHSDQMTALANVSGLQTGTDQYANLKFTKYDDGTITFHNTVSGEMGVYHMSGAYTLFDKDGNIIQNAKGKKFEFKNTAADLKQIITDLRAVIYNLVTPGNLVSSAPGSPVVYTQVSNDLAKLTQVSTDITNLFK